MKGVDKVYHLAALISMQPRDAGQMLNINAEGTANVVNAALGSDISKLLYVSSVAAFGRPEPMGRMIDEHLDIKDSKDNFAYFKSKLYAERELWRGIAEGLNAVIINPSTILGGGFWIMPPNVTIFEQIYRGIPFYTGGSNGFVDVRDVVSVAIQLMESEVSAEKFIVSAENSSWNDMMWAIADALKVRRPFIRVSRPIASLAWRLDAVRSLFSGVPPIVTRDSINLASTDFRYSNEKICKALNFTFRPLNETIAETAAIYLHSVQSKNKYGLLN